MQDQLAAVVELEAAADPLLAIGVRTVEEAVDTRVTVEQQDPGHTETNPEVHAVRLEDQEFAAASGADDREAANAARPRLG